MHTANNNQHTQIHTPTQGYLKTLQNTLFQNDPHLFIYLNNNAVHPQNVQAINCAGTKHLLAV